MSESLDLAVTDVRCFVPAADFALSRAFYRALGWQETWTGDGMAQLELAGHRIMLQDHYVKDWAENFMITVAVASAASWYAHVSKLVTTGSYGAARVAPPKVEDWATVTYVWDPSGVLLHFAQFSG